MTEENKLPESMHALHLKKHFTMFGISCDELSRDDLLCVIAHLAADNEMQREHAARGWAMMYLIHQKRSAA